MHGFGALKEFEQRTGRLAVKHGLVRFAYENDGTPFQWIGLGDGNDSYRSAALTLGVGDFSLKANLFTGRRDKESYDAELEREGGKFGLGKNDDGSSIKPDEGGLFKRIVNVNKGSFHSEGEFGEKYKFALVEERGERYRFGGITANYQGSGVYPGISVGINSDRYVRHPIQNSFAHYIGQPQPMFEVLSGGATPIFNVSTISESKYTEWSNDGSKEQ